MTSITDGSDPGIDPSTDVTCCAEHAVDIKCGEVPFDAVTEPFDFSCFEPIDNFDSDDDDEEPGRDLGTSRNIVSTNHPAVISAEAIFDRRSGSKSVAISYQPEKLMKSGDEVHTDM